jgi:hypothetical protein
MVVVQVCTAPTNTRANSHLPLVTRSALKRYQVAIEALFVRQASHLNARGMERARSLF